MTYSRCHDDSDATDDSCMNYDTDTQHNDEVINNQKDNKTYKPLPTDWPDFFAECLGGIIELQTNPKRILGLPELIFFIQKVTTKARIDARTTIIALILVLRFKAMIRRKHFNHKIQGEYGSCHKIFLSAIIVAMKHSFRSHPYNTYSPSISEEELSLPSPKSSIDERQEHLSETNNPPPILSTTPSSISSSTSSEDYYDIASQQFNNHEDPINQKIAESAGIFSIGEINQMEKSFLKALGNQQLRVSDDNVREFVEKNKCPLNLI